MAVTFLDYFSTTKSEDHEDIIFEHLDICPEIQQVLGGRPHGVAIDPTTNHIYVAEGDLFPSSGGVVVFSESGEVLLRYTHKCMESLRGIAIHGDNLYVTDWVLHAVVHIKIGLDFCLVGKKGSYGSEMGQFKSPRQLSISTNGDLYIADCRNDRIQILDSSLHPIRAITHPSMHRPCDVKLTTDEIYVLSFQDNPCVHVFSYTGHKIRSLITRGVGMQINESHYMCLDAKNNLIMSDFYAQQIKIFSNEGTILHILGQQGHDIGMFKYPRGLALTSNQKLVTLSLNESHILQIFY